MQKKIQNFKIMGMKQDLDPATADSKFAYENKNIRIVVNDDGHTFSIINEQGNQILTYTSSGTSRQTISGVILGHAIINNILILFARNEEESTPINYIYKVVLNSDNTYTLTTLFSDSGKTEKLNFDTDYPIETLVYYESEDIQKVYWVDGLNQFRVINIAETVSSRESSYFDACPILPSGETITITKSSSSGSFAAGTVQYVVTYFNKFGQESFPFIVSPIQYIAHSDRGGAADETVNCAFNITLSNLGTKFDYVRIYSIVRTSLDSTPITKLVNESKIPTASPYTITYTDNNIGGEIVDPSSMFYLGAEPISAETIEQKDNTLFLGNISLQTPVVPETVRNAISGLELEAADRVTINFNTENSSQTAWYDANRVMQLSPASGTYSYSSNLDKSQNQLTTFMCGEKYRLGVQFFHKLGKWSEVIWLNDATNTASLKHTTSNGLHYYSLVYAYTALNQMITISGVQKHISSILRDAGFIKARPVIVFPSEVDRQIVCQGVLCPTVYQKKLTTAGVTYTGGGSGSAGTITVNSERDTQPYVQSSWFFRPDAPFGDGTYNTITSQSWGENVFYDLTFTRHISGSISSVILTYVNSSSTSIPLSLDSDEYSFNVNTQVMTVRLPDSLEADINDIESITYGVSPDIETVPVQNWTTKGNIGKIEIDFNPLNSIAKYADYAISNETENLAIDHSYNLTPLSWLSTTGKTWEQIAELYARLGTTKVSNKELQTGYWYVDRNYVTLNSPDLTYNDSLLNIDFSNCTLELKGIVPITASASNISLVMDAGSGLKSEPQGDDSYTNAVGFLSEYRKLINSSNLNFYGWKCLISAAIWQDVSNYAEIWNERNKLGTDRVGPTWFKTYDQQEIKYYVYPWQRTRSIVDDIGLQQWDGDTEDVQSFRDRAKNSKQAKFAQKKLLNYRYSYFTNYDLDSTTSFLSYGSVKLFQQTDYISAIDLGNSKYYYGNIDTVVNPGKFYKEESSIPIETSSQNMDLRYVGLGSTSDGVVTGYPFYMIDDTQFSGQTQPMNIGIGLTAVNFAMGIYGNNHHWVYNKVISTDSIPVKYKSSTHLLIDLGTRNNVLRKLPQIDWSCYDVSLGINPFNLTNTNPFKVNISSTSDIYGYLWLGNIKRTVSNQYGGQSEYAILNNVWQPGGNVVDIPGESAESQNILLKWTIGDTYLSRFECLKTYPYTNEDSNSVIDVLSFLCESRINLDGVYDKTRGNIDNFNINPSNFAQLNPVYSQKDNFYTYRALDYTKYSQSKFPNQFTWGLTKSIGETVDSWLKISLASIYNLDGDKGSLHKIKRFRNNLFAFQDKGISQIMYNENMQISTTEGVPIEVANSGKVTGAIYLTNTIGCQNKCTVCETSSGLYFIDDNTNSIYALGGEKGLQNIGEFYGMDSWLKKNSGAFTRTCYDEKTGDVYFIGNNYCLSFCEPLRAFSSFYDYNGDTRIFTLGNNTLSILSDEDSFNAKIYKQHAGNYNTFFGSTKAFYTELMANQDPNYTKIFDTVDFISDSWSDKNETSYLPNITIDKLTVNNEYQSSSVNLSFTRDAVSNLQKKFRIWRARIPRVPRVVSGTTTSQLKAERIRNPWTKIKLEKTNVTNPNESTSPTAKTVLHDINVTYYI